MNEKQNEIMLQRTSASVSLELVSPRPKKELDLQTFTNQAEQPLAGQETLTLVFQNGKQNRF